MDVLENNKLCKYDKIMTFFKICRSRYSTLMNNVSDLCVVVCCVVYVMCVDTLWCNVGYVWVVFGVWWMWLWWGIMFYLS